jgi:hypothetical protein
MNLATDGSENGAWRQLDGYGPNAPPDCTASNECGFWIRSFNYQMGTHLIRVNAIKPDSRASSTHTASYTLPYLRPPAPRLVAPSTQDNNGIWWNTRTITFRWEPALRATNYEIRVSTTPDIWSDPPPVFVQTFSGSTTSLDHTYDWDYDRLY